MNRKHTNIGLTLAAALLLGFAGGCSRDNGTGAPSPAPAQVETLTIEGLDDQTWVYVSLEEGRTVGTSPLGDVEQDAVWKARTDWDIAICGELLRTNSGTSGNGAGGIQSVTNKSFNALDEAPADGYLTDTDDRVIRQ